MDARTRTTTVLAAVLAGACMTAQAGPVGGQGDWGTTLLARDGAGHAVALDDASAVFFYDKTLDITWLRAFTGAQKMDWATALAWADGLSLGGFSDWRLPTSIDSGAVGCQYGANGGTDCGVNVLTQLGSSYNELAHLYYVTLGNKAQCAPDPTMQAICTRQSGYGLSNTAYFQGMVSDGYWSATEIYALSAFGFSNVFGTQSDYAKGTLLNVTAVRNGDVLAADVQAVPEPGSLLLAAIALCGLGLASRPR